MLRLAIVEDDLDDSNKLKKMIGKYEKENKQHFEMRIFNNPITFLTNYQANYDLIFMDVQMPYMDGMTAAAKLREIDSDTTLIFITNMVKMATKGYEVAAFDFIVKPVNYELFALKMDRVMEKFSRKNDEKIIVSSDGTKVVLLLNGIYYIEVFDHQLVYHTDKGEYKTYGTMKKLARQLDNKGFHQCNKCYLVNLRYVQSVVKNSVTVNGIKLQISHPRKKAFMEALNNYIGG